MTVASVENKCDRPRADKPTSAAAASPPSFWLATFVRSSCSHDILTDSSHSSDSSCSGPNRPTAAMVWGKSVNAVM